MTKTLTTCALGTLLGLTGCLEFDAQEITVVHDAEENRLDMLLVYRGLHSSSADLEAAIKHLEKGRDEGMFSFWSNFPLKIEPTKGPGAPLAARFLRIEPGNLFTDMNGQLCGFQMLRVIDVQEFLKTVNTMFVLFIRGKVLPKDSDLDHEFDGETRELFSEFLRAGNKIVALQGSAIMVSLPCSDADHRFLKMAAMRGLTEGFAFDLRQRAELHKRLAAAAEEGDYFADSHDVPWDAVEFSARTVESGLEHSPHLRFFAENEVSIQRREGLTVVTIGIPGAVVNKVVKASSGGAPANLEEPLKAQGIAIEYMVPDQEIERRFNSFREREVKMVGKYAEFVGR